MTAAMGFVACSVATINFVVRLSIVAVDVAVPLMIVARAFMGRKGCSNHGRLHSTS